MPRQGGGTEPFPRGQGGRCQRRRGAAARFACTKQSGGVALAMPRSVPGRAPGGGGRALPAAACAGGARHTHGHGEFRRSPAQGLESMPVSLLAAFLREAPTSRARLCLALPHTSGLYLRRTIYNECLPSSRGRIILPSLASLVGGGLGCQRGFSFPAAVQSGGVSPKGVAGAGEGVAAGHPADPAGGCAGEEVSSLDFVSANPFPRLNRP